MKENRLIQIEYNDLIQTYICQECRTEVVITVVIDPKNVDTTEITFCPFCGGKSHEM